MNVRDAVEMLARGESRDVLLDRLLTGDAEPEALTALGLLYVGDELSKLRQGLDELAPQVRNGAGEVVGRMLDVSAALRSDGSGARPASTSPGQA